MRKYIVDTNALLRFFLNDIPEQKRAFEELLNKAKKSKITIYVAQIVVFEVNFILDKYYHLEKQEIIDILQPLVSANYINLESREIFIGALTLYKSVNISFADCYLLVLSKIEKAELFTFDKKLQKLL